jgi:predicted secreted hydrolase
MTLQPLTTLPSSIDWPAAEAAHDGLPWEIWWVATIVQAGDRPPATHVLPTHRAGGGAYISVTITDLDGGIAQTIKHFAEPGEAEFSRDKLSLITKLASFQGSFDEGYRLSADLGDDGRFDLRLKPTRPILYNCGSGQYRLQGITNSQYSIAALNTSGTIRIQGEDLEVRGDGWYDRQWEHANRSEPLAFSWLGLCLDNGETLSIFDTRTETGMPQRWATIAQPDGTHVLTAVEVISTGSCKTSAGRVVPERWKVSIPAVNASLDLSQRLLSDDPAIYTGVVDVRGSYRTQQVAGFGFCDIVGRIV